MLRNVVNLRTDVGQEAHIELVIHGPGIDFPVAGSPHEQTIGELLGAGCVPDGLPQRQGATGCRYTVTGWATTAL